MSNTFSAPSDGPSRLRSNTFDRSGENFRILEPLADKLGAAWAPRARRSRRRFHTERLAGRRTGKIVAPALHIAVGISGAMHFFADHILSLAPGLCSAIGDRSAGVLALDAEQFRAKSEPDPGGLQV